MALIEEVWGSLTPSSPPAPTQPPAPAPTPPPQPPAPAPAPAPTPPPQPKRERKCEPIVETFESPKKQTLTLFLALLITGICSIYAIDMFAESIRNT